MASIALEDLERSLSCPICLDTYQNPKQLQCHHVYCQQCLVKVVIRDQQGQLSLTCPNCRQVTPVPASGVAGLQAAFQINQFLEILEQHKQVQDAAASNEMEGNASRINSCQHEKISVHCPKHSEREVDLYCKTCEATICFKCIMNDEKHHSHQYEELDKAFEKYKVELTESLGPLEKQLIVIEKSLEQLNSYKNKIASQKKVLEIDIRKAFSRLHETLDIRMNELFDQLHCLSQAKLKKLAVQKDQIETIQAQLSSCLQFLVENLEKSNRAEALMMRHGTVEQVKALTSTFPTDLLEFNAGEQIDFIAVSDLASQCRNYGQLVAVGPPDPSKCCIIEHNHAIVGERSAVVIATFDSEHHPCIVQEDAVTCELVSEREGTRMRGNVKATTKNHYEIDFEPKVKGIHQLRIKLEGIHIQGSPYPILVELSTESLGIPTLTIGNKKHPVGVIVNQQSEVIVTEFDGHCVTVFGSNDKNLQSFGSSRFDGNFENPHGITIDSEGNVVIVDSGRSCIQKFTSQGSFIDEVDFSLSVPRGIAFNPVNDLIYVSCEAGWIKVFYSDLRYLGTLCWNGSDIGRLSSPRHIACDNAGNVYVADSGNDRVQVFTTEGKFLRMLGSGRSGERKGDLLMPFGLAIDTQNRVYVSERKNHRISVFSSEGTFLTSFGVKGKEPGEFQEPLGLAFDSDGVLYVCDSGNNRIQLF